MRLYESPIPREEKSHSNRSLLHAELYYLQCHKSFSISLAFSFYLIFSHWGARNIKAGLGCPDYSLALYEQLARSLEGFSGCAERVL